MKSTVCPVRGLNPAKGPLDVTYDWSLIVCQFVLMVAVGEGGRGLNEHEHEWFACGALEHDMI